MAPISDMIADMKFFISGATVDAPAIRLQMDAVEAAGHSVAHDWTNMEFALRDSDRKTKQELWSEWAQHDIQGVLDCDVYVINYNADGAGKGLYVELGAALALAQAHNKPHVYVIGNLEEATIFSAHSAIAKARSIEEIIDRVSAK